jgi:hypothetical protein
MLLSRFDKFDRALKAKGWTYDVQRGVFLNHLGRVLDNESLLRLVPEMACDELDGYRDHRYEQSPKKRLSNAFPTSHAKQVQPTCAASPPSPKVRTLCCA